MVSRLFVIIISGLDGLLSLSIYMTGLYSTQKITQNWRYSYQKEDNPNR